MYFVGTSPIDLHSRVRNCKKKDLYVKPNVNHSHQRPKVPRGLQEIKVPKLRDNDPRQCQVVSLTRRPLLPPENTRGTHFCQRVSRPQGLSVIGRIMSTNNSMTPSGIEPATFPFVSQHLNHCGTAVLSQLRGSGIIFGVWYLILF